MLPITRKAKRLGLFLHSSMPEKTHMNSLFTKLDVYSVDAGIVITLAPAALHYIQKSGKKIKSQPIDPSVIDVLVEKLNCQHAYQSNQFCLLRSLTQGDKQTISSITGYVEPKEYVEQFIQAIDQLDTINDFSLRHKNVLMAAIKAYKLFINGYLQDILTGLDILPGHEFYQREFFTLGIQWLELTEQKKFKRLAADGLNNDELKRVDKALPTSDANTIIQGIRKLQRILPYNNDITLSSLTHADLYREIYDFNSDLREGCNEYVDFLINITQKAKNTNPELVNLGTGKQQRLIAALGEICQTYQHYVLEKLVGLVNTKENGMLELKEPSLPLPSNNLMLSIEKYNTTQKLVNILNDKQESPENKIKEFKNKFESAKDVISQDSDEGAIVFLKKIALIFSSFFYELGLISNNAHNFFKSKHMLVTSCIDSHLSATNYLPASTNW